VRAEVVHEHEPANVRVFSIIYVNDARRGSRWKTVSFVSEMSTADSASILV
jgi:hypothetical protein